MHVKAATARPMVNPSLTPRENYERALVAGPCHQPYPFHCFYCGDELHTDAHYPFCSDVCAINTEIS